MNGTHYSENFRPPTFLAVALLLTLCTPASAQLVLSPPGAPVRRLCPTIHVSCPETFQPLLVFKAVVIGLPSDQKVTYAWSVRDGTIIAGQGTPSITIEPYPDKSITATVDVGGLDKGCEASSSCSMIWEPPILARVFGRYRRLSQSEERKILDSFAVQLRTLPTSMGYIIAYGRNGARGDRAKKYLLEKHDFDPTRLVSLRGGAGEASALELYIVPTGAQPPVPF